MFYQDHSVNQTQVVQSDEPTRSITRSYEMASGETLTLTEEEFKQVVSAFKQLWLQHRKEKEKECKEQK